MTQEITLKSLWDDDYAATLDEPGKLLYRSNLLGSDLRITNFGGGNTSAKVTHKDPLSGDDVQVLWVKGSGGDIGSMRLDGFATLYMSKLMQLRAQYRGLFLEDWSGRLPRWVPSMEDLCFFRNGTLLLGTVSHERICIAYPEDGELAQRFQDAICGWGEADDLEQEHIMLPET